MTTSTSHLLPNHWVRFIYLKTKRKNLLLWICDRSHKFDEAHKWAMQSDLRLNTCSQPWTRENKCKLTHFISLLICWIKWGRIFFSQLGNTARNFSNQALLCLNSVLFVKFQGSLERTGSSRVDIVLLSVIIAGAVVIIGILMLLLFCFWRKKNL